MFLIIHTFIFTKCRSDAVMYAKHREIADFVRNNRTTRENMHPGKRVRWAGFDMDECIGSLMPVWPYCDYMLDHVPQQKRYSFLQEIATRLAAANAASRIWIIRPELDAVLKRLSEAQQRGEIVGCFILSNNASLRLVETVRLMLNIRVTKLTHNRNPLFLVGWHRTAPCRLRRTTKSWDMIQHCLKASGYPQITSKRDLLFYDDLSHLLQKEIPHYIQVPPYYYVTPHKRIHDVLQSMFAEFDLREPAVTATIREADGMEKQEILSDRELMQVPPPAESKREMDVFLAGLDMFLQDGAPSPPRSSSSSPPPRKRGYTRKLRSLTASAYTRRAARRGFGEKK